MSDIHQSPAGLKVLAIVLNWKQPALTLECVRSLQAMTTTARLDILVLDNGSDEGVTGAGAAETVEYLRSNLPAAVRLLALPANLGFGRGNNIGLRQALAERYDFALLINNDAFPATDMLDQLLAHAGESIGLISPKIYYEAEPNILWFASGRRHPRTLDLVETGRGQPDGPTWSVDRDADYLLGTCLLVNLAAVARVGLFDERYFMYFEDLDWSLRMQQAGYRLRLVAGAHLYHRVAASSGGLDSPQRRYHLARSSVIFWRSHSHMGSPAAIALFRLGSAIKMMSRLLLTGQLPAAAAYWHGLVDGWRANAPGTIINGA